MKYINWLAVALVAISTVAAVQVGDNVTFSGNVSGYDCEMSCTVIEGPTETYIHHAYAAYRLRNPDGVSVQTQLREECNMTPLGIVYNESIVYTVDMPGTWEFCVSLFDLFIIETYDPFMCSYELPRCIKESCMTVEVSECTTDMLYMDIYHYFLNWTDGQ